MLALAAPLVLLALVMAHHVRVERRLRNAPPKPRATGRYGVPVAERRKISPAAPAAPADAAAAHRQTGFEPGLEDVLRALADAKAERNERRVTALQIALARHHGAAGRADEAGDLLRTAIHAAVRLGLPEEHAAARLELGDLARASGDLTTACEHWQIARGLYFDAGRSGDLALVEKRMSASGCPTDWVLNDF